MVGRGTQVVKERKLLEVHIEKGMRNNQKIVFHGEADEAPGTIPGDIIFQIQVCVVFQVSGLENWGTQLSCTWGRSDRC